MFFLSWMKYYKYKTRIKGTLTKKRKFLIIYVFLVSFMKVLTTILFFVGSILLPISWIKAVDFLGSL